MSFACVSAILIWAFNFVGSATRAMFVPGVTRWPTSTGSCCEHAGHAGADVQIFDFIHPHSGGGFQLFDRGLLGGELRLDRVARKDEAFFLNRIAIGQFVPFDDGGLVFEIGDEAVLLELVIGLGLHLGLLEFRVHLRGSRFLIEQFALQCRPQSSQFGFGRFFLQLGIARRLLQVGAGELHEQGIRFDVRAWPNDDLFHPAVLGRGDPANVFRHERAEATHLARASGRA